MYAIIQNISVGPISLPDLQLCLGEVQKVRYSAKLQEYAARKLIKILQIVKS